MSGKTLKPVEALKARKLLEDLMPQTAVKSCGIGILNFMKKRNLESPHLYVKTGELFTGPPADEKITSDMAGIAIFQKSSWALHGTSGVITFDVEFGKSAEAHPVSLAVLWDVPYSETLYSNRFNVRIIPRSLRADEKLFNLLSDKSRVAGEYIDFEEEGITVHGSMSKDQRSLLYVECRTPEEAPVGPFIRTEPIKAGKDLQVRLRQWLGECETMNCCALGIDNFTNKISLREPRMYIDTGSCMYSPPERVEPHMAAASLFRKKDYSLTGTSGVLTFDIDDKSRLCVMWQVPFGGGVVLPNCYNVKMIHPSVECDQGLFISMKQNCRQAKDGPITIKERQLEIQAEMGDDAKCLFTVSITDLKDQ